MGGTQLLVPSEVEVDWDEAFNGTEDGISALVPVDVMVYDGLSGDPVVGEDVVLRTNSRDVRLLRTEQVRAAVVDEGDAVWDVWRDRYVTLDRPDAASLALAVRTDSTGLARVYVVVDAFVDEDGSIEGGPWAPSSVTVAIANQEEPLLLVPR